MSSVKVALRIRPLSAKERLNCNRKCVSVLSNGNTPQIILHPDRKFTFDYIFDDDSSQKEVYDTCVKPLLHNFIDGFNATILAYGQTGSGKTYSMGTGLENEMNFENQGIIPRAIYELFSILKKKNSLEYKYKLSVTYLELYNEDLNDLLNPKIKQISNNNINPSQGGVNANTVTLQIREDANGIINWYGVSEVEIESPEDLLSLLEKGSLIRSTGSTDMNMSSSRSHAIFSINLKQEILQEEDNLKNENNNEINNDDIITNDKEYNDENKNNITMNENNIENNNKKDDDKKEKWICLSSKFHFVDLAGSERLKRTGAIGERVKEGITINQGLFALGNVINALTDESHPDRHVPYRDSKLTRLLQDSLGGNSKTLMLSCISCCELDYNESLNTLRYANRARMIKNEAIINRNYRNTDIDYQEFIRMKEEIARLKNELLKAKSNNKNNENNNSDENDETEVENNIDDENGIENQADNDIFDIKDRKKQNDLLREKILNQQCEIEQLNLKINFYESQMCDLKNEIVKAEVERDSLVLNLKLSNYESDDIKGEIRKKIDRILGNAISTNNIDDDNNDNDDNNNNDKYENNKEDKKEFIENEFVESYIRKIENLKEKCMNLEKDLNIQYLINNQSLSKFSMYHDIIMGIDECYSQKKIVPVMDKAREEIQKQIEIVEKKKRDVKIKKETSINKKDDEEINYDLLQSSNSFNNTDPSTNEKNSINELSKSLSLSNYDIDISDFKEDESNSAVYESLLVDQLQSDIQLKEELLEGILFSQQEYNIMKLKYEEKLRLLQNMLTSAQKERDIALKKMNETEDDGKKEKTTDQKRKFEEKIRKLENEIAQLKQKYKNKDKTYSMSKNQNDNLIKNLKTNIENLKNEKNKLLQKMKMEVEKNRRIRFSNEQEIVGLKKREKEASMLAEKLEKNNQIQKALLKKKNEEALNSSKKIKSMMLLINKNKFQNEIINKRTKSSTALYQPRKSVSASTGSNLALYHSKSQSDSSKKKIISKVRTPLKSQEKNSKLLSLQVQWKKQSIDKEIEQFIINQELRMLYNDLLEKKINLELERKEILIKRNFGCKVDTSKEQLISTIENEKLDSIENEIKSIKGKIDKINQLNNIYNINENIHNNIVSYVGNFLKNMISENVQQLVKIYIKELVELRSNFIYSVFHSNIDSDSLDNLLMELKTAKKPYNLIKYYSKLMYPERYPSNLSFIKSDETMNKQGNSSGSVNQTFIDDDSQIMKDNKNSDHQTNDIIKRENSKNQFKMEDEYNRMLKSLESLYNIKLQEEMDDHDDNNGNHQNKRIYGSGDDVSRESHKELNENINKDEYNLDDYYFSNHKRNLSEQNAIIYSNMINSLQQKRNQQANTKREKQNETNKKLIHQRSRSLCDLKNIETDDCIRNSNDKLQNNRNNSKFNKPHIDNSNFNSSKVKTTKSFCSINDLLRKKETPLKKNYSEYISKQINSKVNNPKDDYEKTVNRLKCSITEKICNDIKKEIQDTYDIDISKKTGKTPKKLKYESSDSIKEKIYINH